MFFAIKREAIPWDSNVLSVENWLLRPQVARFLGIVYKRELCIPAGDPLTKPKDAAKPREDVALVDDGKTVSRYSIIAD